MRNFSVSSSRKDFIKVEITANAGIFSFRTIYNTANMTYNNTIILLCDAYSNDARVP